MTQLSKEAVEYTTADFELRVIQLPDVDPDYTRSVYGIFNRHTGVREGYTEQLWMAVLALYGSQSRLDAAMHAIKSGTVEAMEAPGLEPPRMN